MINKFTSRKFLAMIVGVAMGIALAFGADEGTITTISGAVTTIISLVSYIIAEGIVDAAAARIEIHVEKIEDLGHGSE